MTKARDLANAADALDDVSATELGYVNGVTSAIQTQIDGKEPTLPSQTGNSGKYLTTNGSTKSWGTVTQYSLPSQTGNSGKFLTTNGTTESWGTVNQPITWTQRADADTDGNAFNSIVYNGSNLYVAAGQGGRLLSSSDGITWTSRTSNFGTTEIRKVAFGNNLWVAVGDSGKISTSTDGTTWTSRTSNMGTNAIRDVLYANSVWIAVGEGGGTTNTGGIIYSTDGTTWTRKSQSITVGSTYYAVIYNGTNFVVGANNSTNNYLYASTPSGTWTAGNNGTTNANEQILWDGTRSFFIDNAGTNRFSTSSTVGTATTINGGALRSSIGFNTYYNNNLYTIGIQISGYSSTPVNDRAQGRFVLGISPTTQSNSSGTQGDNSKTISVGSYGYIVSDSSGRIFTSF